MRRNIYLGEYTDLIPFSKLVPDNAESKGHLFFFILPISFILFYFIFSKPSAICN